MKSDTEQLKKAKAYALLLLKFRPRSVSEFTERLNRRGFSGQIIGEIESDFKRHGLLDDAKFAKLWVQQRTSLKPMGRRRLESELREKGVSKTDIDEVFDFLKDGFDEYSMAKNIVQGRLRSLSRFDKVVKKRRLYGFLQRRGFSYDVVMKVVKETIG